MNLTSKMDLQQITELATDAAGPVVLDGLKPYALVRRDCALVELPETLARPRRLRAKRFFSRSESFVRYCANFGTSS